MPNIFISTALILVFVRENMSVVIVIDNILFLHIEELLVSYNRSIQFLNLLVTNRHQLILYNLMQSLVDLFLKAITWC